MAGIILPSGGVNRKAKKVPFADLSGVQRNAKTGWLGCPSDGVTRKVFTSGMPVTFQDGGISFSDSYNHYPVYANNSTPELMNFSGGFGSGKVDAIVRLNVKPSDNALYGAGTQLLRFAGNVTISNAPSPSSNNFLYDVDVNILNAPGASFGGTVLLYGNASNPIVDGTYYVDKILSLRATLTGTYYINIRMAVTKSSDNVVKPVKLSAPWSAFTWLPTGQPLVYQP